MIAVITEFLNGFRPANRERPLDEDERALVADALESFLLDEQWLGRGRAIIASTSAIDRLRGSLVKDAEAKCLPHLASVEAQAADLAARLIRQEGANLIMREHLTMMSDQIRALKARDE